MLLIRGMPQVPRALEIALVVASIAMFVGSLAAVPWLLRRMPADHFVRPPEPTPLWRVLVRNSAGAMLVAMGILMLVLPGQGLLTILLGLSIMDLEVKHRIVRRLLCQKNVRHVVQKIRARAGKPPLVIPPRRRRA